MLKKNKAYKIHGHDQACNVEIVSHLKNICILAYLIELKVLNYIFCLSF